MHQLPAFHDENLLAGFENSEDAAVYQIDEERSIIATLDFFTPIVDDPYDFGAIAAANSLSDVYAMGGQPKIALNIVGFPDDMDISILGEILKGGADKVMEAGALLVGGHSVKDKEPKYGLSVVGFVETKRFLANATAQPGDVLILTKALGTGIVSTGIKQGKADPEWEKEATFSMKYLNRYAVDCFEEIIPHSCTDITGFGLIGHAIEMMSGSDTSCELYFEDFPLLPGVMELAEQAVIPGGNFNNQRFYGPQVEKVDITTEESYVAFDPQTSGGLLLSLPEEAAHILLERMKQHVETPVAIIGRVTQKQEKPIILKRRR